MPPGTENSALSHGWRYFELHAKQRLVVFNFFVVLSGLIIAGIAASLQGPDRLAILGGALSILLVMVSLLFWKLDQRVSFLIKHAETAIAEVEKASVPEVARLFRDEPSRFSGVCAAAGTWTRPWTYGRCFRFVFLVVAAMGAAGVVISIGRATGALVWDAQQAGTLAEDECEQRV